MKKMEARCCQCILLGRKIVVFASCIVQSLVLFLYVSSQRFQFFAGGELSGWFGNHDVRRKHKKIFNRFPIVSSSAGAFMHSLNGR